MSVARRATLALLAAATACGSEVPDDVPAEAPPAEEAAARGTPLAIQPREGPPGTEVTLTMSGLIMNARTDVGFGTLAGHEILAQAQADQFGEVSAVVPVPATAEPGTYYFFIAEENGSPLAVSEAFMVLPLP